MGKVEEIIEKINKIIKESNLAYVYTDECACVVKFLNEILDKIHDIQYNEQDEQIYTDILEQLGKLNRIIKGFKQEEWSKSCFQKKVYKPFTKLSEKTKLITESLEKIGIKLEYKYEIHSENVTNELKTIYGIFADPSQQDNPKVAKKLKEIEKYLKKAGQPLFESTFHKRKKRSSKELSNPEELKQNIEENLSENESFNDFSNIQKYKIKKSDYIQEPLEICHTSIYTLYTGQMKSTQEEVNIMVLNSEEYSKEKFQRLVNVLITAQHPNLETLVGVVNSPLPQVVVTLRSGLKLSEIIQTTKKPKKREIQQNNYTPSIWTNGNRTMIAFKIASAMAYLHSLNIIHRDLCSFNVTIDDNFNPRITNFVNSRFLPEEMSMLSSKPFISTKFIAPELTDVDECHNETVDVFSFAGILYEMLTGKIPFDNLLMNEAEEEIKSNHRPKLPQDISSDLKDLIELCWSQDYHHRPSFVDIIDTMISKKIAFPNDSEYVNQFYVSKSVKNDDLNSCVEYFKYIKMAINYSSEYKREILRVRSFLHAYQFVLQNSDYATQDEFEDTDVIINFQNLYTSLVNLFKMVMYTDEERWSGVAPTIPATLIPMSIYQYMEEIYISMTELGFKVSKYEFVNGDLIIDFRNVYSQFQAAEDLPQAKERMKEIEDFLHERGLEVEMTQDELNEKLKATFKQYTNFYLDRNDFNIISKLGEGYTSIVYKAKQISTNELVAIKEFKEKYLREDGIMPYLKREVGSLVKLHHKYLITFIGFNNDPTEKLWLVTKLVNDGELYKANVKQKINAYQKTKIAFEIAEGMEYLHSKRVIHRDLKTKNVLLEGDTPKITDFGYSRTDLSLTMTNQIGTKNYMSPEIILGGDYSFATDVFSYALVLWELYAGIIPYSWVENKIEDEITSNAPLPYDKPISQELGDLIEDAKNIDKKLRPTFSQIIQRMIEKKIHFEGADPEKVEEFYKMKELERNPKKV